MTQETYRKIIDELAELKFQGRLSPHSYGEPLLDKRLPELVEYAKKKIPYCYLDIYTNGDYLDENLLKVLISKGADHFFITNYDDEEKPVLNMLANKYPFHIALRSHKDFEKIDRAGGIYKKGLKLNAPCLRPSSQLIIHWNGDVVLCCQDFYGKYCFGNINRNSLQEIWSSAYFTQCRTELSRGNRSCMTICEYCEDDGGIPW
jgi:8-amino-3,8-dideoxy-alpha-D-manno-octulosonate transaminase